jgi:hypothetical protein
VLITGRGSVLDRAARISRARCRRVAQAAHVVFDRLPYSNENYVRQPKQHWHFGAPLSLILPRKQPQRRFGCAESNQNELLATLEPIGSNDTLDARRSLLKRAKGWMNPAGAFFGRPRELRTRHNMARI